MVCNLVTYRARSAVREVGYALGFPRPLVDRVAKALETYDSVMVRRDLEADGGFAEFFRRPGEGLPAEAARRRGGRRGAGLVDGMGQLNTRVPLVGKVPPWRQPPKPADPNAPRPFAWLHETAGRRRNRERQRRPGADDHAGPRRRDRPGRLDGSDAAPTSRSGVGLGRYDRPTLDARSGWSPASRWRAADGADDRATPEMLMAAARDGPDVASGRRQLPDAPVTGLRSGRPDATTRAARATRRRASPGCGRGAGPATRRIADRLVAAGARRRPGGSTRRAACPSRRRAHGPATDRLGRPNHWDPPAPRPRRPGRRGRPLVGRPRRAGAAAAGPRRQHGRACRDWERWLEFCARIDGFPRHLSIHSGGMLVTAAPLIDIAPIERATMGPRRRPVRQARRRDAQAHQARPARPRDARRDRRDAPADRARLRGLPRPRPAARGDPGGLRDAPGGRHRRASSRSRAGPRCRRCRSRGRRTSTTSSSRSRSSGRARSRATPSTRTCAASRASSR